MNKKTQKRHEELGSITINEVEKKEWKKPSGNILSNKAVEGKTLSTVFEFSAISPFGPS